MTPRSKSRHLVIPGTAVLLALLGVFLAKNGLRSIHRWPAWTSEAIKLKLFPLENASAGAPYDRTALGPLPLATILREMQQAWPRETVARIHEAGLEVGTALLHRSDVEVGELVDGKFAPYPGPSWHINALMVSEIKSSATLFDNEHRYVFRRK